MRIVRFVVALGVATSFLVGVRATPAQSVPSRPNILVMLVDDQAQSTFNRALMPTVFSQIADKGMRFDRHYVASALCCPSRAEILTGLTEGHTGVDTNERTITQPTIVDALQASGYRTAIAGKYLNNHPCETRRREYDLWVCQGTAGSSYSLRNPRLNVNGTWKSHTGVAPEILANYLKDFIGSTPAGQPFFALYTPTSPHMPADDPRYASLPVTPRRPPSFDEDTTAANKPNYTRIPPFDQALVKAVDNDYVRMSRAVRGLDDSVKTLLDGLGPRADNTLVIYVSDNGYLYGEHRGHFKEAAYEESINTPLAIRYPSSMKPGLVGSVSKALVQNIDLAPTLAQQAGIEWDVDGASLMPLLTGASDAVRSAALIEHCSGPSFPCAVARRDYTGIGFFNPPSYRGVVESRMKYVSYATGERELYDLATDPHELTNLAGRSPWAAEQQRLAARLAEVGADPGPKTTLYFASTDRGTSPLSTRTVAFRYLGNSYDAAFVCRLTRNGAVAEWDSCPSTGFGASALVDGNYVFEVAAVRGATQDPTPAQRSFTIAAKGPRFTINAPPATSRQRSGRITFTAPSNVTNIECQLTSSGVGSWKPCTPTAGLTYSDLANGRWIFRVRGMLNGVTSSPPSEATFRVDLVGPVAVFSTTPAASTKATSADFAFTFSEPTAGPVTCVIDARPPAACGSRSFRADGIPEGVHTLRVTALDPLGNRRETATSWTVDRTPPSVTAQSPSGLTGPNAQVKLTASEAVQWIFSLDGGANFDADPAFMFMYSLPDGQHTLRSRAYDAAGNLSPVITQTWMQSSSAPSNAASASPSPVIDAGPSGNAYRGTAGFSFRGAGRFECSLDGGGFAPCTSPAFFEDLPIGPHRFSVRTRNGDAVSAATTRRWSVLA